MNEGKLLPVFKAIKNKWLIITLTAAGIILLLIGGGRLASGDGDGKSDAAPNADSDDVAAYTEALEKRISNICERVEGVSDVFVLLTLECGSEYVYAENSSGGSVDYLVISSNDGEKPLLLREIFARVRGIAVVCSGGDKASVKRTLSELLSCALGVPLNNISIAGTD